MMRARPPANRPADRPAQPQGGGTVTGSHLPALAGLLLAAAGFAAAGGFAAPAAAFSAGDPARGEEFALKRCAICHEVPGGGRRTGIAPAFLAVAADEETYPFEALKESVRVPHWGGRRVSRGDAADVISWILLLRAEPPGDSE